jgi:hypothetical protein
VLAFAAGVTIPATPSGMRALWPSLISDGELRLTAYALQGAAFSGAFLIAPLLVSGLLLVGGASLALGVAAILAGAGGVAFAITKAPRQWRPGAPAARRKRRLPGLATPGLRTLLGATSGLEIGVSLVNLVSPATAVARGSAALAGVIFAIAAAGDVIGGLFYGSRRWAPTLRTRLLAAEAVAAVLVCCLALTATSLWALAGVTVLVGAVGAVAKVTTSTLTDHVADPGIVTQSYASLVCGGLIGNWAGYFAGALWSVPRALGRHSWWLPGAGGSSSCGWCIGAAAWPHDRGWLAHRARVVRRPHTGRHQTD